MQYLAELRKEKAFVGFKAEIKLLARNSADNNWQGISSEEIVPIPDGNQVKDFRDGQMLLVEISGAKTIQNIQEASKRLVLLLQNFSRLQDKYKQSEEEIEQWKQSLNYQSQELHRREVELADREQELEQIELRRKEAEEVQALAQRDRLEIEKLRQELETARREFDAESAVISLDQAEYLRDLITRIANFLIGTDYLYDQIGGCLNNLYERQEILNSFWQHYKTIEYSQTDLTSELQELNYRRQLLEQNHNRIIDLESEIKADEQVVKVKEKTEAILRSQIEAQQQVIQQISQLIASYGGNPTDALDPAEIKRLEEMATDELEMEINKLQQEFDKGARAVGEQEDELAALEGEIADLQCQIDQATGIEKIELESSKELAEENYQFLEASVSGMRANMLERQATLNQQRAILDRRQGIDTSDDPAKKIMPILSLIEAEKFAQEIKLRDTIAELDQARNNFKQKQEALNRLNFEAKKIRQDQELAETSLRDKIAINVEVTTNRKILQPVQDIVDLLRQKMESIVHEANLAQSEQAPQQLIQNLQQAINALVPNR